MHIEHAALGTTTYRDWFPPRRSRHSRSAVVSVVARRTTIIIILLCAYVQVELVVPKTRLLHTIQYPRCNVYCM